MALSIPDQVFPFTASRLAGGDTSHNVASTNKGLCLIPIRAVTNGASAPDGATPSSGTWSIVATGTYEYTFDQDVAPAEMVMAFTEVEEDSGNTNMKVISYTASTRKLRVKAFLNSGGTYTATNIDDIPFHILFVGAYGDDYST